VTAALRTLIEELRPRRILDTGCGTGYWLQTLQSLAPFTCGIDLSLNMLHCVPSESQRPALVCGSAGRRMPFREASFDLIFCVNALPNFGPVGAFLIETRRMLAPGGAVAIIGATPDERYDSSYLYHSFGGVHHTDAHKFPSWGAITDGMVNAEFERIQWRRLERIVATRQGRDILGDTLATRSASTIAMLIGYSPR
jgi:ubiquinone/menaquinone biosynthesis C-methylase UbiE